jgi:FkbM family methyltransferase
MNLYRLFQLIPEIKGKHRVGRFLFSNTISNKKNEIISCLNGVQICCPNFKEYIAFELLINGIYESRNIEFMIENTPKNGVLFDVGANIGAIAIMIAKQRPDLHIYCFEASTKVFSYLKKNIELNDINNITAIHCLLIDEVKGELPFYSPEEQNGKGSMAPVFTSSSEMIQTETLDHFMEENKISKVDFIKIDVEGFEHTVLSGTISIITNHKPKILFEFLDWAEELSKENKIGDAQRFLLDNGYKIFNLSNHMIDLKEPILVGGADLVGVPK